MAGCGSEIFNKMRYVCRTNTIVLVSAHQNQHGRNTMYCIRTVRTQPVLPSGGFWTLPLTSSSLSPPLVAAAVNNAFVRMSLLAPVESVDHALAVVTIFPVYCRDLLQQSRIIQVLVAARKTFRLKTILEEDTAENETKSSGRNIVLSVLPTTLNSFVVVDDSNKK